MYTYTHTYMDLRIRAEQAVVQSAADTKTVFFITFALNAKLKPPL